MSGKVPDFKSLRNKVSNLESRISYNLSNSPAKLVVDEELHSALRTRPKAHTRSYDKELLNKAKQEMELIQKELNNYSETDSLCLSSESENSKLSSSFKVSKSSVGGRNKLSRSRNGYKAPDPFETIRKLQEAIKEKDKRIEVLEEKLVEKQQVAENSMKKLTHTTKLIKNNEKDIELFKRECEDKLDEYKKIIAKLELENKEVYGRVKNAEKDRDKMHEKLMEVKRKSGSFEEIKRQNLELKKKFEDSLKLAENLQTRYENLVESSMIFEEKTRELYKANQVLQENILRLLPES